LVTNYFEIQIDLQNFPEPLLDNKGRLWVKTESGLCRYQNESNTLCKITSSNRIIEKSRFDNYFSSYQDSDGILWFGTFGYGILKYASVNEKFRTISGYENRPMSISGIFETPDHKIVAQAYQTNDPILCNLEQDAFVKPFLQLSAEDKNLRNCNSMVFDSGYIYLGYEHLFRISLKNGSFTKFPLPGKPQTKSDIIFDPLHIDKLGRLWCANGYPTGQKKLFQLDKSNGAIIQTFEFPDADFHHEYRFVSDWIEDDVGNFWFGTLKGVYFFNTDSNSWQQYSLQTDSKAKHEGEMVFSICLDPVSPDSFLWVGTNGFGLKKLNMISGKVVLFNTENGLPNDVIYGIESDDVNNLWLSTNNGLCLFERATGATQNFTEDNGLQSAEFNRYAHLKMKNGMLLFAGVNGINVFNPADFYRKESVSTTLINGFKIYNKAVETGEEVNGKVLFSSPLEYTSEITLRHNLSMITLSFALSDLSNPAGNKYKYKLEGFKDDWIDAGELHEATFTNLSPGSYTFQVLGCNSSNVWSTEPATLQITILPPWWGTFWFRLLIGAAVVSSIYALFRFRLAQKMRLLTLRNRIASDLHDDLGSTLSSISLSSTIIQKKVKEEGEVKDLLNQISTNTDNMMEAMSDIVWSINTKNDRFDHVINRMRAFAVEMLEPKGCLIHFHTVEKINTLTLDMAQRKNLYLIFKEAINNAAKYSACSNVFIDLTMKANNRIHLRVKDDGKGFDLNYAVNGNRQDNFGGNGLSSIYKRSQELNGEVKIITAFGKGTEVDLEFRI